MNKKILLTKAWTNGDVEYPVGSLLELDAESADELIAAGTAKAHVESEPDEKDKKGTEPPQYVTVEALTKMFEEKLAAERKAATPRPEPIRVVKERIEDDPTRGYGKDFNRGFGRFLTDVVQAGPPHSGRYSDNLKACVCTKGALTDEMHTIEDSLGGFLIPPQYMPEILKKGMERDYIRTNGARTMTINSTLIEWPALSDTARSSTLYGGINVYFQKELAQMTATRPEFEKIELKPKMLTGMCYMTQNLMTQVPYLGGFIAGLFQDAILWKEKDKFMNGTGAGEPLGILNAGCVYSLAKETGQAAATIVTANVLKMRSHMRDEEYESAVWLASHSCMEQLNSLTMVVGVGGAPIGLVKIGDDGISRLLGRPLIYTGNCAAIGTVGDLVLVSYPTYIIAETVYRDVSSSIHIRFDYNEVAFRVVKTIDAQPWWRTTLTLENSWEVAPIVTLAARA